MSATTSPSSDRPTVPDADGEVEAPTVLGHFALGRQLGGGGMGVVFEARDTVLGRTVALKLLRPDVSLRGDKGRARLLREAQALAALKHPNVVTVHEVGSAGGEIFVAMELCEGDTLREWMRTPHPWRAVVDMFVAVGRGLAAAHALGLVHRDVKPANVLVDRGGVPKIGDFGLVSAADAVATRDDDDDRADDDQAGAAPEDAAGAAPDPRAPGRGALTSTGTVMGTPAYMAPEQIAGERTDARADQYAFGVSLHEALTGVLPRPGAAGPAGAGDGVAGPRAAGRPMPPRLAAIVARATAARPDDRYPSMDAVVAALVRARRGRRTLWLAGGAALATVAVATATWALTSATSSAAADPCPAPVAAIEPVWGAARQAALGQHARAIDPGQGGARVAAITASVAPYVRDWGERRVTACRATRVDGTQSDSLLDLRVRCLDRRLDALADALALVDSARTPAELDAAAVGLVGLPPVADCDDTAALSAAPPLASPAARAAADRLTRQVDAIGARLAASRTDAALVDAQRAVADARALGHPPTLAAALLLLSRVQAEQSDASGQLATLKELTQVAARAHDDRDEAWAWTKQISLLGFALGKPDQAMALVPAASAAVLRAGEPTDLAADLLLAQGAALDGGPRAAEGLARLEEARALLERAGAATAGSPLRAHLGELLTEEAFAHGSLGDREAAIADLRRVITMWQDLYGPDSRDEAHAWHQLGEYLRRAGRLDDALAAYRTAVRIMEARQGDSPALALALVGVADVLDGKDQTTDALSVYDRALAVAQKTMQPDDPRLANVMVGRGLVLREAKRLDEAARAFDDTIALLESHHAEVTNLPITYFNRGELRDQQGRCDAALADYARADALFAKIGGPRDEYRVYPLTAQGRCLLELGRPADALAPLTLATTLTAGGLASDMALEAQLWLGRALVDSGRDRARGAAMAHGAVKALDNIPQRLRPEMERWLAAHR